VGPAGSTVAGCANSPAVGSNLQQRVARASCRAPARRELDTCVPALAHAPARGGDKELTCHGVSMRRGYSDSVAGPFRCRVGTEAFSPYLTAPADPAARR
jgi:hypothetical protein